MDLASKNTPGRVLKVVGDKTTSKVYEKKLSFLQ